MFILLLLHNVPLHLGGDDLQFFLQLLASQVTVLQPLGPDAIQRARTESLDYIRWVSKHSLRRKVLVKAKYHRSREVQESADEELEDILEIEERLADYFHVERRNFRSRRHACNFLTPSDTPCRCKNMGDVVVNSSIAYTRALVMLFVRSKMTESRWGLCQLMLRLMFFSVMMNFIGVDGWKQEYKLRKIAELDDNNLSAEQLLRALSDYKTELSKRLNGCTETMRDDCLLQYFCLDEIGLEPIDDFLAHIQEIDAESNKESVEAPLRLQWFYDTSPLIVAQRELFALMAPQGELRILLDLWLNATHGEFGSGHDEFFATWAMRYFVLCIQQSAGLEFRFGSRSRSYPGKSWIVCAMRWRWGPHDQRTIDAAHTTFHDPPCCKDVPWTLKAHNCCEAPRDLIFGAVGEQMYASARGKEVHEVNVDLENDQSLAQHVNDTRGSVSCDHLAITAPLRQWEREHCARGGKIECKITTERIGQAQVTTRQTKKKARRAGNYSRLPSAFFLCRAHAAKKYQMERRVAAAAAAAAHVVDGPQLPLPGRKVKSKAYRERLEVRCNGWQPFEDVMAALRDRWEADLPLQKYWKRQREQYIQRLRTCQAAVPTPVILRKNAKRDLAPNETLWGAGWARGPCSPQTLNLAVARYRKPARPGIWSQRRKSGEADQHLAGAISTGDYLKKKRSLDTFVSDPLEKRQKTLAPLPKEPLRKTCWQKHPGFCPAKWNLRYQHIVERCATNLNTLYKPVDTYKGLGKGLYFIVASADATQWSVNTVAMIRKSDPTVQYFVCSEVVEFAPDGKPKIVQFHFDDMDHYKMLPSYEYITLRVAEFVRDAELDGEEDVTSVRFQSVDLVPKRCALHESLLFEVVETITSDLLGGGLPIEIMNNVIDRPKKSTDKHDADADWVKNTSNKISEAEKIKQMLDKVRKSLGFVSGLPGRDNRGHGGRGRGGRARGGRARRGRGRGDRGKAGRGGGNDDAADDDSVGGEAGYDVDKHAVESSDSGDHAAEGSDSGASVESFERRVLGRPEEPPSVGDRSGPREFRITDRLLEMFDYTQDCPGCNAKQHGEDRPRHHSDACRARIEACLIAAGDTTVLDQRDARRLGV